MGVQQQTVDTGSMPVQHPHACRKRPVVCRTVRARPWLVAVLIHICDLEEPNNEITESNETRVAQL